MWCKSMTWEDRQGPTWQSYEDVLSSRQKFLLIICERGTQAKMNKACVYRCGDIRLSHEQSVKVEYERERLLGIANKFINFLAIPSSLSRSYSTFPLRSGTTLIEIAVHIYWGRADQYSWAAWQTPLVAVSPAFCVDVYGDIILWQRQYTVHNPCICVVIICKCSSIPHIATLIRSVLLGLPKRPHQYTNFNLMLFLFRTFKVK